MFTIFLSYHKVHNFPANLSYASVVRSGSINSHFKDLYIFHTNIRRNWWRLPQPASDFVEIGHSFIWIESDVSYSVSRSHIFDGKHAFA